MQGTITRNFQGAPLPLGISGPLILLSPRGSAQYPGTLANEVLDLSPNLYDVSPQLMGAVRPALFVIIVKTISHGHDIHVAEGTGTPGGGQNRFFAAQAFKTIRGQTHSHSGSVFVNIPLPSPAVIESGINRGNIDHAGQPGHVSVPALPGPDDIPFPFKVNAVNAHRQPR